MPSPVGPRWRTRPRRSTPLPYRLPVTCRALGRALSRAPRDLSGRPAQDGLGALEGATYDNAGIGDREFADVRIERALAFLYHANPASWPRSVAETSDMYPSI